MRAVDILKEWLWENGYKSLDFGHVQFANSNAHYIQVTNLKEGEKPGLGTNNILVTISSNCQKVLVSTYGGPHPVVEAGWLSDPLFFPNFKNIMKDIGIMPINESSRIA